MQHGWVDVRWSSMNFPMDVMGWFPWWPSWLISISLENGPVEIVDLPMNSMVDLSIVFCFSLPEGNWYSHATSQSQYAYCRKRDSGVERCFLAWRRKTTPLPFIDFGCIKSTMSDRSKHCCSFQVWWYFCSANSSFELRIWLCQWQGDFEFRAELMLEKCYNGWL